MNFKKVSAIALAFVMLATNVAFAADYDGHWAGKTIQKWLNNGYVTGYKDGSIKPDGKITRAEFVTMANKSLGFSLTGEAKNPFKDVKNSDWFHDQIVIAVEKGYIAGITPTKFAPNVNITREQAAVIASAARKLPESTKAIKFKDNAKIASWAIEAVKSCVEAGVISGRPDGSFDPKANLTRAEAMIILDKLMEYGKDTTKPADVDKTMRIPTYNTKDLEPSRTPSGGSGGSGGPAGPVAPTAKTPQELIKTPLTAEEKALAYVFDFVIQTDGSAEPRVQESITRAGTEMEKTTVESAISAAFKNGTYDSSLQRYADRLNAYLLAKKITVEVNGVSIDAKVIDPQVWPKFIEQLGAENVPADLQSGYKTITVAHIKDYIQNIILKRTHQQVQDGVNRAKQIAPEFAYKASFTPEQTLLDTPLGDYTLAQVYQLYNKVTNKHLEVTVTETDSTGKLVTSGYTELTITTK